MSKKRISAEEALAQWDPENAHQWAQAGRQIAYRNLLISIPCLFLGFATWIIWSVMAVQLNHIGFHFSREQLFTLTAVPPLVGATLRILYSFVIPIFGGRNWTVLSTASLLIPTLWLGHAVQDPTTSYGTFLAIAACCGFGGGNFASSMSNISFFFPKKMQGTVLGLNAGLGNLGVGGVQLMAPMVLGLSLFGAWGGDPQIWTEGALTKQIWLQNAAYIWVCFIAFFTMMAFIFMNNLATIGADFKAQFHIFKRKYMYITTFLYTMSFGSFIGYSVAFPLLCSIVFKDIDPLKFAFIGPLLGGVIRPVGGFVSDKVGGAIVTLWTIAVMILSMFGVIYFMQPDTQSFVGFLSMFFLLFFASGVANGSVFRMIGVIFHAQEKAPALGFSSAISAFGGFFIPKLFGWSIHNTGTVNMALWSFIAFYGVCLGVTWYCFCRKGCEVKC